MKKTLVLTVAAVAAVTTAQAQTNIVINGNFCSVANIQTPIGSGAGLNSGTAEWNDLTAATGVFAATDSTSSLLFTNGNTVDPSITLSWSAESQDSHDSRNDPGFEVTNNHEELFAGYLSSLNQQITLSGTNVLSALQAENASVTSYDLYLYIDGEDATATPEIGTYTVSLQPGTTTTGESTYYGEDTTDFITNTDGGLSEYVQASSTNSLAPTAGANYVKFTGITSDGFSVLLDGTNPDSVVLNGFEIVAVPEPSTFALLFGAIALGVIAFRRRK